MSELRNVATELLGPNVRERPHKTAFVDEGGRCTFAELDDRVARLAGWLRSSGLSMESRVLIVMEDCIDYVVVCLGAIKAGLVPVMINPLLTSDDFAYMLDDSRARLLVASEATWERLEAIVADRPHLERILLSGGSIPEGAGALSDAVAFGRPIAESAPTHLDDVCLWQYSSGSTGRPKGTMHTHGAILALPSLYPKEVLGIQEGDVTFSAAKLFFGYGFGNGMIFPLAAGATAWLMAGRPTAGAVWKRLKESGATIFYGVPTLYSSMLADPDAPGRNELSLRLCTSAGEALPASVGQQWSNRYGAEILDGIGSTEMLHIFLSNRPGDVCYGTTGRPVQGYDIRLVGDDGLPVARGEIGELHIQGPTAAAGYWDNRPKTRSTFLGEWVRSGDKFVQDENGRFVFCGRADDMLKVSGIYVSPLEVEEALRGHDAVSEAAVIGWKDDAGLVKPKAFVVLSHGYAASDALAGELKAHVKATLAPYKYPRWLDFVEGLPKTATGKIERYRLRAGEQA
jgi:benzoate-CoA ligase